MPFPVSQRNYPLITRRRHNMATGSASPEWLEEEHAFAELKNYEERSHQSRSFDTRAQQ